MRYSKCKNCSAKEKPIRYVAGYGVLCIDCYSEKHVSTNENLVWKKFYGLTIGKMPKESTTHAFMDSDKRSVCGKLNTENGWSRSEVSDTNYCKQCVKMIKKRTGIDILTETGDKKCLE